MERERQGEKETHCTTSPAESAETATPTRNAQGPARGGHDIRKGCGWRVSQDSSSVPGKCENEKELGAQEAPGDGRGPDFLCG